jgi:hypothetical protein
MSIVFKLITCLFSDDNANLFTIGNRGLVQMVRKPVADDQSRYHTLTIIAESQDGKTANATVSFLACLPQNSQ